MFLRDNAPYLMILTASDQRTLMHPKDLDAPKGPQGIISSAAGHWLDEGKPIQACLLLLAHLSNRSQSYLGSSLKGVNAWDAGPNVQGPHS